MVIQLELYVTKDDLKYNELRNRFAGASVDPNESAEREARNALISQKAAADGMVLLDNEADVLPIAKEGGVALYGQGIYATVKGGTGSGDVY